MNSILNHIGYNSVALLALAIAAGPMEVRATTISNVATVQWDVGTTTVTRASNQVDLAVGGTGAPSLSLSTFQFSASAAAQKFAVPETICRGTRGEAVETLDGAYADTPLTPASLTQTTQIRAGEPLIVVIDSAQDNRDPLKVDTLVVTLTTPGGDSETVVLQESNINTGRFVGLIRTASVPPSPTTGDCQLSLSPGETLVLSSRRENGQLVASSPVEVLVDPYGVVFDSGDGAPVSGSTVSIVDGDTGAPVTVYGDDAKSIFPSTVKSGSTVIDASGAAYKFRGRISFPLRQAGTLPDRRHAPGPISRRRNRSPRSWRACCGPTAIRSR